MSNPVVSSPLGPLDKDLLLGTALGAFFVYAAIPANFGANLSPAVNAGLQAALGGFIGLSLGANYFAKFSWNQIWKDWVNPKGDGNSPAYWKGLTAISLTAAVAQLIFPNDKMIQASATLIFPYVTKKGWF